LALGRPEGYKRRLRAKHRH